MKSPIAIIALSWAFASSVLAQNEVVFGNTPPYAVNVNSSVGGTDFTHISGADNYYFALFNSTNEASVSGSTAPIVGGGETFAFSDTNWTFDAYGASTAGAGGRFGSTTLDTYGATAIPGVTGTDTSYFVVIGWSANIGTTIASVESFLDDTDPGVDSGFVGQSEVTGSIEPAIPNSPVPPPSLFGSAAPMIPGFNLGDIIPTPEPSVIALSAMGGLSLLSFRRKKSDK